jgi:hypothetical protein
MTDVVNVGTAANSGNGDALRDAFILVNAEFAKRGVADGYASLGSNGLVPTGQLPSYVDTVIEYATYSAFPATGASGSIYLALDTGFSYRWSGTVYVNVSGTVNSVNGQTGTVTLTASGIGSSAVGGVSATTVQAAIAELDAEKTSAATLAASGGAALVGFIQSGTGAVARTVQAELRDRVNPFQFGAVGNGVDDDSNAVQLAINTGKHVDLLGYSFAVNNLTQSTSGQAIISSRGVAMLLKNANGPVLTSTGANCQLHNVDLRDDADAWTGAGIVSSGANLTLINCGGYHIFAPVVVATGNHVTIRGTCNIYHSRTSADYDIEIGSAGTATLYHELIGVYTSQSTGGIRMTSTGTSSVSGSQFGKLTCVAGGEPTGSSGPRIVNNRINGVVTTDQANGIFDGNQLNANVTLQAGALNTSIGQSNVWAAGATLTNNSGAFVHAEVFSSGKTSSNSLSSNAQVTQFGDSSGLAFMAAHPDTGAFEFFGAVYANTFNLPNNVAYTGRQTAGAGGALFNLAKVDTSNNILLGSNAGNYTQVSGASNGIYISVGGTTIAQWYGSGLRPQTDNVHNIGTGAQRWATIYAGTGTINTSDERAKEQWSAISQAERNVAVKAKALLKSFKFTVLASISVSGHSPSRLLLNPRAWSQSITQSSATTSGRSRRKSSMRMAPS